MRAGNCSGEGGCVLYSSSHLSAYNAPCIKSGACMGCFLPARRCVAIEQDVDACITAIKGLLLVCPESQARQRKPCCALLKCCMSLWQPV
jgi:hypothetical protein